MIQTNRKSVREYEVAIQEKSKSTANKRIKKMVSFTIN